MFNMRTVVTAFAAATLLGSGAAVGQDKPQVRVGYFAQLHDAAVLDLENQLGDRYDFEYVRFQRYADAAIALTRGDIDISSLGYANLITEAAKNNDPKFQFVAGLARGAINLVCNNNVEIRDWSDLKGKSIGIVAGFPEVFLDDSLEKHGESPRDIEKVNFAVAGPPVLQALQNGTTDCSAVFEPFGATAVSGGYAYYPPTNIADNSFKGLNNALAVSTEFASSNAEAVKAITSAIETSTARFKEQPQDWIAFMTESQDFPHDIVEIGVERVTLDAALYPQEAQLLAQKMQSLGLIRKAPDEKQLNAFFAQQ